MTGLADANMDRAPVVAIISRVRLNAHKESHQNTDSVAMTTDFKWSQSILSADNITGWSGKPLKWPEKPGVTVIELPEDLAKLAGDTPLTPVKVRRPAADHKAIAQAVDLIGKASNPIFCNGL